MENIEKCECVIGIMYDYDDTHSITRKELEEEIRINEIRNLVEIVNGIANFTQEMIIAIKE